MVPVLSPRPRRQSSWIDPLSYAPHATLAIAAQRAMAVAMI
jgi:hypothetical protein